MGLRTSEVLKRVVRDLDDGARYLWIDEGKTASARRHLEVPALVQPYLLRLASGKRPDELLVGVGEVTGEPHLRQSMHWMVRQLCQKAGVPRVCTHSLRGLWATLAVGSGIASHAVAESLSHHSFAHSDQPEVIVLVNIADERQ
jgi:integrase